MSQKNKSVLFNTSAGSDVQYSGGEILIAGLDAVKLSRVINFSQINYRAEVAQVITIGATAYTPTASTAYSVEIGDVNVRDHGYTSSLKKFTYTTPDDITTLGASAALQREAITLKLVAEINAGSPFVTAATLTLGNGFTVTDKAGYFPYNRQGNNGRQGASVVRPTTNTDGTGFAASNFVLTTAAVYEFGTGLNLLNNAPVYDFMTGNLISGEIETPLTAAGLTAVSVQKYNMFNISYLDLVALPTAFNGTSRVYLVKNQTAYVDNGAGASTANATGYAAFERNLQRGILSIYAQDQASIVEFFDGAPIAGAKAGGAPVGTTGAENTLHLSSGNVLHYAILGAGQTLTAPAYVATGLQLDLDAADNEGAEYSAPVDAVSGKEFVVGKTEFSLIWKASIADVSDTDDCLVGFRKKEAYQAAVDNYDELAALNVNAGDIFISTILNGAATVDTDTTLNWADTETHELEVRVLESGAVKFLVDGVDKTSVQSTAYSFDAGEVVIPFIYVLNAAASAPTVVVSKFAAVPAIWKA